jgi:hypothetical protein
MIIPSYTASHPADALQAALLLSGRHPAIIGANDLAWQQQHQVTLTMESRSTAVIVACDNGYDIRRVRRGCIGPVIARVRQRGQG